MSSLMNLSGLESVKYQLNDNGTGYFWSLMIYQSGVIASGIAVQVITLSIKGCLYYNSIENINDFSAVNILFCTT